VPALRPPIPLELMEYGLASTVRRLASVELRDVPPSPDGGVIADYTGAVGDPESLALRLSAVPGVVAHGLFAPSLVSEVLVAGKRDVERRRVR
jgi:ribose 5-phosphate isomerase A